MMYRWFDALMLSLRKRGRPFHISIHMRNRNCIKGNDEKEIRDTTESAFMLYSDDDPSHSIKKLIELKGIGAYRASLLLSTVYPSTMPFLSDELCEWVATDQQIYSRKMVHINKYYPAVRTAIQRLEVSAVDIEKVAFVLKCERSVSSEFDLLLRT